MIHTNRCKHCGKTKEEHGKLGMSLMNMGGDDCYGFTDSGLAALDAHKEELYEVANDICDEYHYTGRIDIATELRLQSILNQIEKEK